MSDRSPRMPAEIDRVSGDETGGHVYQTAPLFGVRELLTVLFKYKVTIIVTFLLIAGGTAAVTLLLTPTYESSSKLLVKFGRENVYRSEVGDDKAQILQSNSEEVLNSEVGILTSRDLIERVVATLTVPELYPRLVNHPPSRGTLLDAAVEQFQTDLSVEAVKKSSVIELALRNEDPRVAAKALGLLMDLYKEKHLQAYSDPKSSYLEGQLATYEHQLKQSEDELEDFKQKHGVYSIAEQRTLLLKQRTDLDTQLKSTQNQINEDRQRIASLQAPLQTVSPDVPLSTDSDRYRGVDDAKNQLLTLQLKEQDLLRKYTPSNSLVVSVRQEIATVQEFIKTQEQDLKNRVRTGQNVVYQGLQVDLLKVQAELPALEARAASLRSQIAQLDRDIPKLDFAETDLENMQRDISVNDQNYRTYKAKVEEALTADDLNRRKSANMTVIQDPTVPVKPIALHRLRYLSIGLLAGLFAGVALAFAREFLSQGMSTPESAEQRLGLPVLVAIPLKK